MKKKILLTIVLTIIIQFVTISITESDGKTYQKFKPKFGLIFQKYSNPYLASKTYCFYWGFQNTAEELSKYNLKGIYLPAFNICAGVSIGVNKFCPDINYIIQNRPHWIRYYKNGKVIESIEGNHCWVKLDIGNSEYIEYAIKWVYNQIKITNNKIKNIGFDNAMFMYANKSWEKYETNEQYHNTWEKLLIRLSEAFRPRYKIVLNVGSCDLPTFARMIRWVDGVLQEDLCYPPHRPGFDPEKARKTIADRWEKGQWCMENGKIWAVRYNSTINALRLATTPKAPDAYISVGEGEVLVSTSKQDILGKINLGGPHAETLAQLAQALEGLGLKVDILNPYTETSPAGTLQPLKYGRIGEGLTLKFKQAPREAFLFGYCAMLMAAGPNSFFIIGDERHQEYYYPEMDWPLGSPKGPRKEIAPMVYKRDFEFYDALLNLSDNPFLLPDGQYLKPFRGALVKKK